VIGSVDTALGSVDTAGGTQTGGSGPGSGVQSVTGIVPGLVDNTDPANPIILQQGIQSVTGASVNNTDPANPVIVDPFLLELGYGHGTAGTDDTLPTIGFWFDKATDADHAIGAGNVPNEWESEGAYNWISLDVYVYRATILDDETPSTCQLAVTVDGVATGVVVTLSSGSITNVRKQASASITLEDADRVGLAFVPDGHYTGGTLYCTAVIRASYGPPPAPPAPTPEPGPRLWLNARVGLTTSGGKADKLDDQSGNGQDAIASPQPGADRPTFNPTSTNGLAGLTFTPASALVGQGMEFLGANLYADGAPRTCFAVVRPGNGNSIFGVKGGTVFSFRRSTPLFGLYLITFGGPAQFAYTNGVAVNVQVTTPVDYSNTPVLCVWRCDGSTITLEVNGVHVATMTAAIGPETGSGPGYTLGNMGPNNDDGQLFFGDFNELLVYDGAQTDGQIERTKNYLATDWGITLP
jgi:hypothetical protein